MAHQVDLEWLRDDVDRPIDRVVIVQAVGLGGLKRIIAQLNHYYEIVAYNVKFDGKDIELDGDGGLADAVAAYNAIDEDRPC